MFSKMSSIANSSVADTEDVGEQGKKPAEQLLTVIDPVDQVQVKDFSLSACIAILIEGGGVGYIIFGKVHLHRS